MLKILFITHEVTSFSCHGMAGDIAESLTRALKKNGHEVRIVTPRYRCIRERKHGLRDVARLREMSITFGGQVYPASVKSGFVPHSKVQVYFVENDDLFPESPSNDCISEESLLCSLFLSHAALQLIAHLNWIPDVIYCCGWRTAATPYLLKYNPKYITGNHPVKSLMHFCARTGDHILTLADFERYDLQLPPSTVTLPTLRQLGLQSADSVIQSEEENLGLAGALMKSLCLTDPGWDPRTDPKLSVNYGSEDILQGKAANKTAVQGKYGLDTAADALLIALWGDAVQDESAVMMRHFSEAFPDLNLQFVEVNGSGHPSHTSNICFDESSDRRVSVVRGVAEGDLRMIEAGSDFALHAVNSSVPDFRPLSSLLYGAAPIISKSASQTASTEVIDILTSRGTGFGYESGNSTSLSEALRVASETYRNRETWNELMRLGMERDYYWEQAARHIMLNIQHPTSDSGI